MVSVGISRRMNKKSSFKVHSVEHYLSKNILVIKIK